MLKTSDYWGRRGRHRKNKHNICMRLKIIFQCMFLVGYIAIYFVVTKMTLKFRGVRGIFFRGGKVIFLFFFPGVECFSTAENFHFSRPKQILVVLKSEKQKRTKKQKQKQRKRNQTKPRKRKGLSSFCNFS